jgi:hypothetical protein
MGPGWEIMEFRITDVVVAGSMVVIAPESKMIRGDKG